MFFSILIRFPPFLVGLLTCDPDFVVESLESKPDRRVIDPKICYTLNEFYSEINQDSNNVVTNKAVVTLRCKIDRFYSVV